MAGLAGLRGLARKLRPCFQQRALSLNAAAVAQLAHDHDHDHAPVMVLDLFRFRARDRAGALTALDTAATRGHTVTELTPHPTHSVLLGDAETHHFDRIVFRQFDSPADAHAYVTDPGLAAVRDLACKGSLMLRVTRAVFAALPSPGQETDAAAFMDTVPPTGQGLASPCPFVKDPTAQQDAWVALHEQPSQGRMVAMNLINIPPHLREAYTEVRLFSVCPALHDLA